MRCGVFFRISVGTPRPRIRGRVICTLGWDPSISETDRIAGDTEIGVWQCAPLPRAQSQADDHAVADNLARLEATLAQVSGTVDLLVTPEMFVSGYNVGAEAARFRADPVLRAT